VCFVFILLIVFTEETRLRLIRRSTTLTSPSQKRSAHDRQRRNFSQTASQRRRSAYPETKAADQREVDKVVYAAVKKTEYLAKYLKASWGLSKGEYPHQLVF
jgi:hypothetical protein